MRECQNAVCAGPLTSASAARAAPHCLSFAETFSAALAPPVGVLLRWQRFLVIFTTILMMLCVDIWRAAVPPPGAVVALFAPTDTQAHKTARLSTRGPTRLSPTPRSQQDVPNAGDQLLRGGAGDPRVQPRVRRAVPRLHRARRRSTSCAQGGADCSLLPTGAAPATFLPITTLPPLSRHLFLAAWCTQGLLRAPGPVQGRAGLVLRQLRVPPISGRGALPRQGKPRCCGPLSRGVRSHTCLLLCRPHAWRKQGLMARAPSPPLRCDGGCARRKPTEKWPPPDHRRPHHLRAGPSGQDGPRARVRTQQLPGGLGPPVAVDRRRVQDPHRKDRLVLLEHGAFYSNTALSTQPCMLSRTEAGRRNARPKIV